MIAPRDMANAIQRKFRLTENTPLCVKKAINGKKETTMPKIILLQITFS